MKKHIIIILIIFIALLIPPSPCKATQEEIIQNQSETLNIKEFISQANKYTKNVFDGLDAGTVLKDAISGKIDNQTLFTKILGLFGKEIKDTLKIIRKHNSYYSNT